MILTSYLIGALFVKEKHGLCGIFVGGFLIQLGIWELISLPAIYLQWSLSRLSLVIMSVVTAVSVVSVLEKKTGLLAPLQSVWKAWTGRLFRFFRLKADLRTIRS